VNSSKLYNVSFMYHSPMKLNPSQILSTTPGFILLLTNSVAEAGESAVYVKSWNLADESSPFLLFRMRQQNSVTHLTVRYPKSRRAPETVCLKHVTVYADTLTGEKSGLFNEIGTQYEIHSTTSPPLSVPLPSTNLWYVCRILSPDPPGCNIRPLYYRRHVRV
jgi:hypothetical protein